MSPWDPVIATRMASSWGGEMVRCLPGFKPGPTRFAAHAMGFPARVPEPRVPVAPPESRIPQRPAWTRW
ncbi:hypothetical protein GCM10009566_05770 [Streptomyces murinus]